MSDIASPPMPGQPLNPPGQPLNPPGQPLNPPTINTQTAAPAVVVLTQQQINAATQPLVDDAIQTEKEIQSLVAAYKAHGVAGVSALLPALGSTALEDYKDVEVAIPAVKVGYKTTEFWVFIGVTVVDLYFGITGKEAPATVTEILAALSAAYGISRGMTKAISK